MPIPNQSWRILRHHSERDRSDESDNKSFGLLPSIGLRVFADMERSNSVCGGYSTREYQLLFENVELAKGNCKEHSVIGATCREGNEFANIIFGRFT